MKRLAIFTTSRAEFGLLTPVLEESKTRDKLEVLLFVGGAHLLKSQGFSVENIKNIYPVTETFDFLTEESSSKSLSKSLIKETEILADIFAKYKFDLILLLGDRFELLPIVSLAVVNRIPIAHIHGGEITEGAIDEQIRHMITKASHLHFASCQEYKNNIIRMGEEKNRVVSCGALAVDNIKNIQKISKEELFSNLGLDISKQTVLLTYHPVTLERNISIETQFDNILKALEKYNLQVLITAPNVDEGREIIQNKINEYVADKINFHFIKTLGAKRYLSFIPHCEFVIGNSSSGIIEVPYFKIPTVNIGERQKGRIQHKSIVDTDYSIEDIQKSIEKALDQKFLNQIKKMEYKFGNGNAAKIIIDEILKTEINSDFMKKKLVFEK